MVTHCFDVAVDIMKGVQIYKCLGNLLKLTGRIELAINA